MKKLLLLLLVSALFAMGRPQAAQVTIKSDPDKIKAALLTDLVRQGFIVDSDNQYQLQVSKPLDMFHEAPLSGREVLGSPFGHSASPLDAGYHDCRVVHPIVLIPNGDATSVTMSYEEMCRHAGGDTVREVRINKDLVEKMQAELDSVKGKLEK